MSEPAYIKRDCFARMTLYRRLAPALRPCAWCGDQNGRFHYWWKDDSSRPHRHDPNAKNFCCIGCYRSYTGGTA